MISTESKFASAISKCACCTLLQAVQAVLLPATNSAWKANTWHSETHRGGGRGEGKGAPLSVPSPLFNFGQFMSWQGKSGVLFLLKVMVLSTCSRCMGVKGSEDEAENLRLTDLLVSSVSCDAKVVANGQLVHCLAKG